MSPNAVTQGADWVVRPAKSIEEANNHCWPLMKTLGWNRDYDDAITHYHVAHNGANWLLLVPAASATPVGEIVAFAYDNGTGWVGFFLMNAEHRGKGWGAALFNAALAVFIQSETFCVGLDGVEEQVGTYGRRGFVDTAQIKLMNRPALKEKALDNTEHQLEDGEKLVDIRHVDGRTLQAIDFAHTGFQRSRLWTQEALFCRKDAFGYGMSHSDKVTGFVLVRRCDHGHRVGPLYADSYREASILLRAALEHVKDADGSFIAEIFGDCKDGINVFEEQGWAYAGLDYHRMWLGGKVPKQQREGGKGRTGMFAIFDAAEG